MIELVSVQLVLVNWNWVWQWVYYKEIYVKSSKFGQQSIIASKMLYTTCLHFLPPSENLKLETLSDNIDLVRSVIPLPLWRSFLWEGGKQNHQFIHDACLEFKTEDNLPVLLWLSCPWLVPGVLWRSLPPDGWNKNSSVIRYPHSWWQFYYTLHRLFTFYILTKLLSENFSE